MTIDQCRILRVHRVEVQPKPHQRRLRHVGDKDVRSGQQLVEQ
eukprot:CAMPEP_0204298926 /NCGR_PEP_ID=MMETSP0468-20130131/75881_1 /ASSEMBLY_ACC=CAM_ASM_000383 /TAXON_ID=2969 /ORGANISM="Oxyrrhis marina" /LENGTH=42 /DNA_ID= /DNA_START= /DNA_END= /DNA_ORIENTATION=